MAGRLGRVRREREPSRAPARSTRISDAGADTDTFVDVTGSGYDAVLTANSF